MSEQMPLVHHAIQQASSMVFGISFGDHDLSTTAHDSPDGLCNIELLITTTMSGSRATARGVVGHIPPRESLIK